MAKICDNEDEIADIGNDLLELRLVLKALKEKALPFFGPCILEVGREPL